MAVVETIAATYGKDVSFTYSIYHVAPSGQQAAAKRTDILKVRASNLTHRWLSNCLETLGSQEELAWHSRVALGKDDFHIPMIDFLGRPQLAVLRRTGRQVSSQMRLQTNFLYYDAGRSFHGYAPVLIPAKEWPEYLGHLLLLNLPGKRPIVDARWVGHALIRGFAALRWSHNTSRYLALPHIISGSKRAAFSRIPASQ